MNHSEQDHRGEQDGTGSLKDLYADLLRIEQHWTEQVQNQQRRIAAVLAVNGFLLASLFIPALFDGANEFGPDGPSILSWSP